MPILDVRDLKKSFGPRALLDGVTCTLEEGERVGLVGKNGCGKSTFAKILAGVEPDDGGILAKQRGARIGYLAQVPDLDPKRSAWDEACAGLSRWNDAKAAYDDALAQLERGHATDAVLLAQSEALGRLEHLGGWDPHHRVRAILDHLGVRDSSRALGTMSGGEQRRVALARLLIEEPDLAILDEPTNHLDADTIEWLEEYVLETYRGAVLFVTHDRYFLDRIVTRTWELENGTLHSYDGGYESYLLAKAEREEQAALDEQKRQNFVRRELEWLRRTPAARTGKQKARIQRAEAVIAERGPERTRAVELLHETSRSGNTILDLKALSVAVGEGAEVRTLIQSLDLALVKGERVGIVGPNGSGKSTLLKTVLGERKPTSGSVTLGQTMKIAYLDQARSGLDPTKSIAENVAPGLEKVDVAGQRMDTRSYLERFLFDPWTQRQPVASLSGGERARVLVAKMLLQPASLMILDEPTNDLDVATLSSLEAMLVEMRGTCLVVTHDRYFLDRVATAILAFEGDGKVVKYEGNYSMYRELKREAEARAAKDAAVAPKPSKAPPAPTKAKKGLTYAERIELDGILDAIDAAEQAVKAAHDALADPELFSKRGHEVPQRQRTSEEAQRTLEALVARWEALETKKAEGA